jgi:hypothetical protein
MSIFLLFELLQSSDTFWKTLSHISVLSHSRPPSRFHTVTRWKLSFGLDDKRERSDLLLREVLFRRSWTIFARQNYAINICQHKYFVPCKNSLWKLLRVLKFPNWKARGLKSTASFLPLSVPCFPAPKEDARANNPWGRGLS